MARWPAWCVALEIGGMPAAIDYATAGLENTRPIQFTNIRLPSMPAGIDANSLVLEWLEDSKAASSGFSFSTGIRRPFPTGNNIKCKVMDLMFNEDTSNQYSISRIVSRDNGDIFTGWQINKTVLLSSDTQFQVVSSPDFGQPLINRLYWIRTECIKVTAIALVAGTDSTYLVTVQRGCCGSRAVDHSIIPRLYVDSGISEKLHLDTYPDFGTYDFEATIRYIRIDGAGVPTVKLTRHGLVDGKPSAGLDHFVFSISDLSKPMSKHQVCVNDAPVELSNHIRIISFLQGQALDRKLAESATLWLTRLEAETIFNYCLHTEDNPNLDSDLVNDLSSGIDFSDDISYKIVIESNGHKFLYGITSLQFTEVTLLTGDIKRCVQVKLDLIKASVDGGLKKPVVSANASISDNIVNVPVTDGTSGAILNAGWWPFDAITIPAGIERPKVKLRIWMNTTPVKCILYFLLSRNGNGRNHATYDALIGWRGLGFASSKVNVGVANVDPLLVSEDTIILEELNQLVDRKFDFRFEDKDKFEEIASNIMRLHLFMMGPKPDTGALSMRKWARHINSQVLNLDFINDEDVTDVRLDETLDKVVAIQFSSGLDELELKPLYTRLIRISGANQNDVSQNTQAIRIWKRENLIGDDQLEFGIMHDCYYAFFVLIRQTPNVYSIRMSVEDDLFPVTYGETVNWESDFVPTNQVPGRGIDKNFIVTSVDVNMVEGEYFLKVIRDCINLLVRVQGSQCPDLQVLSVLDYSVSGETFVEMMVRPIGDDTADLAVDYFGVIQAINSQVGYLKVVDLNLHNVKGFSYQEPGARTYHGYLIGLTKQSNTLYSVTMQFSENYQTDNADVIDSLGPHSDSIRAGTVFIRMTDYRPASKFIDGTVVSPLSLEGYDQDLFARVAPSSALQSYDGALYIID